MAKRPRSTFYYQEVKRDYSVEKAAIFSLYQASKQRDGYRPLTFKLRQIGFTLNHKTVLKLMRELQIQSIVRKKRYGR
ncbi:MULTISPECIES: IS3 family transposase [unclassified Avibacterium]|uniref:IS3 family transposase n=1 Tax=unclassified Avibacterium TaxID=2685287 RepID=UPI002026A270|nr:MULTISPECIES: IS3 family transposase [unclassified Avibacterium]MCW9698876.1 IS3 family transposase [Avibacterium sp. 20-129]URL06908.1 IS3 family transposase [Avibacterium sp. 21-595]